MMIFFTSHLLFDNYDHYVILTLILAMISMILLFEFVVKVGEISQKVNVIVIIFIVLMVVLYIFSQNLIYFTLVASVITLVSFVLFFTIYHRQRDGKSLGFALGLLCSMIASGIGGAMKETMGDISGLLLILSGVLYVLGFLGIFNQKKV